MDGDDVSVPERLHLLYDFMEQNPQIGVCGSHFQLFGDINEISVMEMNSNMIKAKLIYTNAMSHGPSIYRTEIFKGNNIYYTNNHPYMEDYDLFFRVKGLTEFAHLDKVLYNYRILKHNSTVKNIHTILDRRTDPTWPTTWFVPRLSDSDAFKDVYSVMANWGANHGAISYGHIGADLITLASMVRIPVCMHNVAPEKIFRPSAWASMVSEKGAADYKACEVYGPLYK